MKKVFNVKLRASGIIYDDEGNCPFLGYFFWARKRSAPGVPGAERPALMNLFGYKKNKDFLRGLGRSAQYKWYMRAGYVAVSAAALCLIATASLAAKVVFNYDPLGQ
jgi:hypothetical protein